jgi:hypothetical protein
MQRKSGGDDEVETSPRSGEPYCWTVVNLEPGGLTMAMFTLGLTFGVAIINAGNRGSQFVLGLP